MTIISVGRQGQEIGDFHLEGIREGLVNGYFLPDDYGWYEGLSEWLPLIEIVERLSNQLPPIPLAKLSPFTSQRPPTNRPTTQKIEQNKKPTNQATQKIKQSLKPKKGQVTYLLKKEKATRRKIKTSPAHSWESDPATDKQIAFLKTLGAREFPKTLTKGEAHDQIDSLLGHSRGQAHSFLSPKQLACLNYYGIDSSKFNYDEAKAWLDRVHESPESFDVPEPWETAKYRLYPRLYPDPNPKRSRGCLIFIFLLVLIVIAVVTSTAEFSTAPTVGSSFSPRTSTGAGAVLPSSQVPKPVTEDIYRGMANTVFGKDWVIVDGKKIEGVDVLIPEHGGIITIVHTGGGVNVPANKLPQGFLNAWAMTPEVLEAYDKSKGAGK